MRKNKILIAIIVLLILGTGYYFYNKQNKNTLVVGNDKDVHGCITSAGYVFSPLKNSCIRIFETGVKMDPKDDSLDQNSAAYVVFKSMTDYKVVELYLPGQNVPLNLNYKSGIWTDADGKYTLAEAGKNLLLLNEGRALLYEYEQK